MATSNETRACDKCGYTGPKGEADGEKAVVWYEDAWTCQECKFKNQKKSRGGRSPRRGGMGSGGLGR